MKPEAQRIAIAEACGWHREVSLNKNFRYVWKRDSEYCFALPDFLNDLNAMHEAEQVLNQNQCFDYHDRIQDTVLKVESKCSVDFAFGATAAQRAEAFLETIFKWSE